MPDPTHGGAAHFDNRAAEVRRIDDRILTVSRKSGPVWEEPKKTFIHLARKTALARIATRKDPLILSLKSASDIASPRVFRENRHSANRWHVEFQLERAGDVDRELTTRLKRGYHLAGSPSPQYPGPARRTLSRGAT